MSRVETELERKCSCLHHDVSCATSVQTFVKCRSIDVSDVRSPAPTPTMHSLFHPFIILQQSADVINRDASRKVPILRRAVQSHVCFELFEKGQKTNCLYFISIESVKELSCYDFRHPCRYQSSQYSSGNSRQQICSREARDFTRSWLKALGVTYMYRKTL